MKISELIFEVEKLKEVKRAADSPSTQYILRAYDRVIQKLREMDVRTKATGRKITALDVTPHMKGVLKGLIANKPITNKPTIEAKVSKASVKADLIGLLGVGPKKADEIIAAGLKHINQIKMKKYQQFLNAETQLHLQYKPERRIPRDVIKKHEDILVDFKASAGGRAEVKIVGSYRRGADFSKDIDVMIVSDDEHVLNKYVEYLSGLPKVSLYIYSKGPDKMSFIIGFDQGAYYKLDIFRTSIEEKIPMLLYATGSKDFNIRMRGIARKKGLLLNQKGLFTRADKKKIPIKTEKDIFTKLGMPYVAPKDR